MIRILIASKRRLSLLAILDRRHEKSGLEYMILFLNLLAPMAMVNSVRKTVVKRVNRLGRWDQASCP
jgi:hypothetical protein